MPTSAQKKQRAAAHAKGQAALTEKHAALASDTAIDDLWNQLQAANSRIEELEQLLAQKDTDLCKMQSELEKTKKKLVESWDDSKLMKKRQDDTSHRLHMERQRLERGKVKMAQLEDQVEILRKAETEAAAGHLCGSQQSEQALKLLRTENNNLRTEFSKSMDWWTSQLEKTCSKLEASTADMKTLRQAASKLCKKVVHSKELKNRAIAAAKAKIAHQ